MDSDPIKANTKGPNAFTEIIADMVSSVQYKLFALMFMVFILINSNAFINRALYKFSNAVEHKSPTNWGVILQGMFLVISCILIDVSIKQNII